MTLPKFIHHAAGALVALALGLASALPAHAEKIRVGYWPSGITLGFGAYLEAGSFFKDQGLDAEFVHFSDVNGPTRALAANAIDFAFGSPAAGAFALATDGVPVKIVLATQPANVTFVVHEDSPIRSLADLKGKKVGMSPAGSSTATIAAAVLAGNHGLAEKDFALVPGNEARLVQFLAQREVDAAALRNVTVAQIKDLKLRTLSTFAEEWRKLSGSDGAPYNAVGAVRADYLEKNPDAVVRSIVALRKALERGQAQPDEVTGAVRKAANLPEESARVFADLWRENYRVSLTAADQQTLKREFEIFKANGTLKGELPASALDPAPYEKSLAIR